MFGWRDSLRTAKSVVVLGNNWRGHVCTRKEMTLLILLLDLASSTLQNFLLKFMYSRHEIL